jgi:serine/threonine protein kinase/Flp pilus assembly protein TadD
MKTKDWQQIEDLFHEALNIKAEERSAYLAEACNGDEELRVEVESLLGAFESKESFIEQPAFSLGMKLLSDSADGTLLGKTIGQYKIVRLLGRGGGGEVYLAEDSKLNREVALKFFTSQVMDNVWVRRQLTKEARAVARLEHPHICAVHGIEEIDGHHFMVMQYVEGETLDSLLSRGPLELKRILELAEQIISALAAAHAHGIIHRDIKPQNVIVTPDGQIKMLDFGLAKIVQQTQTRETDGEDQSQYSQAGLIVGTVAYMSPEQLRAEELDFRSDIFSVGILLYELVSGKNPYKQTSEAETISATLTSRPAPLSHPVTKVPPALNAMVHRCLEKDKQRRYQSARELYAALDGLQHASRSRIRFSPRAVAALVLCTLLIAGLWFAYARLTRVHTLVVLPLINRSTDADAAYMGSGLTQSLVDQLSHLSKLRIKAPPLVPGYQDGSVDPQQIGRELKADAVFTAKLEKRGESLILQTALVSTADGSTLWKEEYDIRMTEIQTLPNRISEKIASTLQPWVSGSEKRLLAKGQTENAEAYRLYLLGRSHWESRDKENILKAIDYFKKATDLDPVYAQAWAGLADSYVWQSTVAYGSVPTEDAMQKARAAARRALEIDDTLCEAHISLGLVKLRYEWNWKDAEREFKRAIEINPDNASAHFWYANLLTVTGRSDEAIAESKTAKELDPFSPLIVMNLGRAYYRAREYDKAIEYLKRMLEENPKNSSASYILGYVYLQKGMYDEAIEIFQNLSATRKWLAAAPLGYAYARAGRKAEALKILDEIEEESKKEEATKENIPAQERAIIYIGLDDKDQAFYWLEKAYEERFGSLIALTSDPIFDSLRSDSRFADLARRINLTP